LIDILGSKVDNAINLNNEANETLASTVDTQQICELQNDEGRRTKVKIDVLKLNLPKMVKKPWKNLLLSLTSFWMIWN